KRYQDLRDALVAHRQTIGTTFDLDSPDSYYLEAAQRLAGGKPRIVIFGHTHIPKYVRLTGGGVYINTGTWCPTIRLPDHLYQPGPNDKTVEAELAQFVDDLANNRLQPWSQLRTLFAHLTITNEKTQAALCEFTADGKVQTVGGPHEFGG